jgi:hypothetical protein
MNAITLPTPAVSANTSALRSKAAQAQRLCDAVIERLREELPPKTVMYTVLRRVSASGMLRVIDLIAIKDGVPFHYSYRASIALGWKLDKNRAGIRVGGCGMDMGFHLVYSLSYVLHGDGYALDQRWL